MGLLSGFTNGLDRLTMNSLGGGLLGDVINPNPLAPQQQAPVQGGLLGSQAPPVPQQPQFTDDQHRALRSQFLTSLGSALSQGPTLGAGIANGVQNYQQNAATQIQANRAQQMQEQAQQQAAQRQFALAGFQKEMQAASGDIAKQQQIVTGYAPLIGAAEANSYAALFKGMKPEPDDVVGNAFPGTDPVTGKTGMFFKTKSGKTIPANLLPQRQLATDGAGNIYDTHAEGNPIVHETPKPPKEQEYKTVSTAQGLFRVPNTGADAQPQPLLGPDGKPLQAYHPPVAAHAAGSTTPTPIEPGSREFKVAQDLAYGKLTMQDFRGLYSYSRDINKKLDIYGKAADLNPAFNPSQFEMGYKLAANPKVQQQMASLDNVQTGIPDLLKFSDAATRSGAPILNNAIIKGGIAIGGKKYSDFNTARTAFADELSGALGYGSATDMSREMGFNMTDKNLSPEAFRSAVQNVISPFVDRKRASLLKQMGPYGQPPMNPNAPTPPAPPTSRPPLSSFGGRK